jgi:hypothetical protein
LSFLPVLFVDSVDVVVERCHEPLLPPELLVAVDDDEAAAAAAAVVDVDGDFDPGKRVEY